MTLTSWRPSLNDSIGAPSVGWKIRTALPGSNTAVGGSIDLLAGFDLDLVERGDRDLRAIDEQSRLVAVLEIDDDPLLLKDLDGVLHRGQRFDRVGPVDPLVTGEGVDHPPDDEHRTAGDHETGDQEPTVEPPARCGLGRGRVVDERHDSMMPAHNPTHPPDSVSRSW